MYLTPDLATVGFSGFNRLREAVDIGYRTAIVELATSADAIGGGRVR